MTQVLQPNVTVALTNADLAVDNLAQRVLICGQMTSNGSEFASGSGDLIENIASTGAPENALYGEESQIAGMIRAFKALNPRVQLDAIAVVDASGTAAEKTITIVGTASAAGTLTVIAGSEKNHLFSIAVANADSPTVIASAIAAAIEADAKCPYAAAASVGVVTLTVENDGLVGDGLGVEVRGSVAGITGQAVVSSVPGATDPTLTALLAPATARYQAIVWAWDQDVAVLKTYLDARFNASNAVLDGVGFMAIHDSLSNITTDLSAHNSQSLVFFGDKLESETNYKGPAQNEAPYVKAAQFAAIRALRLTDGAAISRFLTSSSSLDQFGGSALASLPYFNTPMPNLPLISAGRGWTDVEIESLLDLGVSIMGVNSAGDTALVGEVVTSYLTNPAAVPDPTFTFLNYVDTASGIREYVANNLKSRFAQTRLTTGAVNRGRDMANADVIRAFVEQLYLDLSGTAFSLVEAGAGAIKTFKESLVITLDTSDGSVDISADYPIVTQLRTITMTIRIAFSQT